MKLTTLQTLCVVIIIIVSGLTNVYSSNSDTIISPSHGPDKGILFMTGGGSVPNFLSDEFASLMGGKNKRLILVTSASTTPLAPKLLTMWVNKGFTNVRILHTTDLNIANSDTFAAVIDSAIAIWFNGGSPTLLAPCYLGTKTYVAFQNLLKRGGVIGGESAGSMVQGQWDGLYMVNPPIFPVPVGVDFTNFPMFNFVPGLVVIPHVNKGGIVKWNQCVSIIQGYPQVLGIGLPEAKGVIVKKDIMKMHGDSIAIYDSTTIRNCNPQACYLMLFHGETFDIKNRKQINYRPRIGKQITNITIPINVPFQYKLPDSVLYDINEGDSLSFIAKNTNGSTLPAWLSFDSKTLTFTGTPVSQEVVTIKLTATDTSGANMSTNFTVNAVIPQNIKRQNSENSFISMNEKSKTLEIMRNINAEACKIYIYDVLGKLRFIETLQSVENKYIDISSLNKGIYHVILLSKNERICDKIVIR